LATRRRPADAGWLSAGAADDIDAPIDGGADWVSFARALATRDSREPPVHLLREMTRKVR